MARVTGLWQRTLFGIFLVVGLTGWAGLAAGQPALEGTLQDSQAVDADGDGQVDRGDTIEYRMRVRNTGDSDATSVGVTVPMGDYLTLLPGSVMIGPIALDDTAQVQLAGSVVISVLANDRDIDGSLDLASLEVVTQGAAGTATVDSVNGAIAYQSTGGAGVDAFTYRVADNDGLFSREATVSVAVDSCPTAQDDAGMVLAGGTLTANVLDDNGNGADTDADSDDTLTVTAVNGAPGDVGVQITLPSGALLTLNADGSFDYDPNGVFVGLAGAAMESDSFTYTVSDGFCDDVATVLIEITGENECPVAQNDAFMVDEKSTAGGDVLADNGSGADSDVDDGATLMVTALNGMAGDIGMAVALPSGALITLNGNGAFTYDPNGAFDALAASESDTDSFAYTLSDGTCAVTGTATITINGENDCPVAADDAVSTGEDSPGTGSVLADNGSGADADTDTSDTITVTAVNGAGASVGVEITLASGALLTLNSDGSYTYDPNDSFESLDTTETDTDSFTYTVSDGTCTDTATVTVTIDGVNDCPVAADDAVTTDEDTTLNGNVLSNNGSGADADVDTSDTPTVTAVNGQGANVGSPVTLGSGAIVTLNANGAFAYNPNGAFENLAAGADDTDTFTYTLSDGACSDDATVTVTLTGVNDAPSATAKSSSGLGNIELVGNTGGLDAAAAASPATTVALSLLTGASDPDTAAGSLAVVPDSGMSSQGGAFETFADGSFVYAPPAGFTAGNDTFTFTITDGTATSSAATVTIAVSNLVWFIDNTAGGSGGTGTARDPFLTIADFNTANGGGAGMPASGDRIYLRAGAGNYTSGITLLDNQTLEGEGVALVVNSTTLVNAGSAPVITSTTNNGVTLASGNTLRGFNVNNTPGFFKVSGAAAGNLAVSSVSLLGTGGAIQIATSAAFGANVTFDVLESTSSPGPGLSLTGVTGTLGVTSAGSGIDSTADGSPAVFVSGGTVALTYGGNLTKANSGALVSVAGGHGTGALVFGGTLSATAGTGLLFDNADGTYTFNGATTLNGGDAGIDIQTGSDGNFTFVNAPITNPTGTAFVVSGGGGVISHTGAITKSSAGTLINISARTGGSVTLASSLTQTNGTNGIQITSCSGGTVTFNGSSVNLSTAQNGLTLQNNTGATTAFTGGDFDVTASAGRGIEATSGGTLQISGVSNAFSATGQPVLDVDNTSLNVTFASLTAASSAGNGLELTNLPASSSFTVTGSTIVTAPAGQGIVIDDVEAASTITFGNASITNRGSHGIFVQDFDGASLSFGDVGIPNGLSAGGNGVHVQTSGGMATSTGALTFASLDISATNATVNRTDAGGDGIADNETDDGHAVRLMDHTGGFTVTGDGVQGDGGTIQNIEGDGFSLIRSGGLNLDEMTINNIGTANQAAATVENAGIRAADLKGTNRISNSTISRFQDGSVGGGSSRGISVVNNNQSFTEMRVTDTTFFNDNSLLGDDAISLETYNAVSGALIVESATNLGNVNNQSDFFQVSGHGVQVIQNGSGILTVSISDTTFRDTITPGGFGGIDIASAGSGILSSNIDECLFLDLYPGGVNNSGVITFFGSQTVDFDATVNNCTFGSASQRTSDGRGAIRASTDTDLSSFVTDFDITITNNTIDDTDREAISIFPRGGAVPLAGGQAMDIVISGNDIGQTTPVSNDAGLGREGIEIVATENAKRINLTLENNIITNFVDSSSDETVDIDANGSCTIVARVRGNSFSQSGSTTDSIDFSTVNAAASFCLDMNSANTASNTCPGGITITETAGTFSIEDIGGSGNAAATVKTFIEARNSGTATVSGTFDSCNEF